MADCVEPASGPLTTNSAMAHFINMLKDALKVCNADKAALRTWAGDESRAEVVTEVVPASPD